ncbi:hypothetical protein AEQ67_30425 [Pseudomonas sp. RIT-PI-q]|nr:hypothetical protein AEQ67_30425 [Pseudomonas sp. RIT-PI-q]
MRMCIALGTQLIGMIQRDIGDLKVLEIGYTADLQEYLVPLLPILKLHVRQACPPQLHQKIWILKGDYLRTVRWPIRTHANLLNSKVRHLSAAIGLRLISNNLRLFLIQRLHPSYRYAYDWRVN